MVQRRKEGSRGGEEKRKGGRERRRSSAERASDRGEEEREDELHDPYERGGSRLSCALACVRVRACSVRRRRRRWSEIEPSIDGGTTNHNRCCRSYPRFRGSYLNDLHGKTSHVAVDCYYFGRYSAYLSVSPSLVNRHFIAM